MDEKKSIEEKKETIDQKGGCCNNNNHATKVLLVIITILMILGGVAVVAKMSFGWHDQTGKARINNIALERGGVMRGKVAGMRIDRQARSGITGDITKIDGNNITVKVSDKEYIVTINENTSLSKVGQIAKQSDLKAGDTIKVIGPSKSDGSISANRIMIK